ncbi:MAG: rhomboid family intramembrane serine protease [Gemmatimonadales bacterium]
MYERSFSSRITPWVGRLLAINAVVLLLTETLFTAPAVIDWLRFDPTTAFGRMWSFLTYMFVHGGLFHLAANSIALFAFGPAVERRLGGRAFLVYYLYCGVGAAVTSLLLSTLMPIAPFVGASGAVLGVALAYARFFPDAELIVFPIPMPIRARTLVMVIAGLDLFGALAGSGDGIAHVAHLGGLLFGMLYFGVQNLAHPPEGPRLPPMRPRGIPVGVARREHREDGGGSAQRERSESMASAPAAPVVPDPAELEAAELDRVLDKINASGMNSLTHDERAFLDGVARRRRDAGD